MKENQNKLSIRTALEDFTNYYKWKDISMSSMHRELNRKKEENKKSQISIKEEISTHPHYLFLV